MKHHPDRGGDEATFKKISEAYDILSDPQKKSKLSI
jgi:curved DNA-binding protein CbpA